jgi:hypothetical protein
MTSRKQIELEAQVENVEAVDSTTHRVYAPEQEEDGKPVSRMVIYEAVVR